MKLIQQLVSLVNQLSLTKSRLFVALLIDEMKIKEGLVYNKHSGAVIGFTCLDDINDQLLKLEQENELPAIAKQVLVLMVRGIFFKLEFPILELVE